MAKHSRSGGKYTGNHTTLIPAAAVVCGIAEALPEVTKISPGFIKASLSSVSGRKRIKFTDESGNCILLSVRDSTTHQEVRVYVTDLQAARTALSRKILASNIGIAFRK